MSEIINNEYIINNWDLFYKSYLDLNPDLEQNNIVSKRSLLNHFIKHGISENRKVIKNFSEININPIKETKIFILKREMIIENIF